MWLCSSFSLVLSAGGRLRRCGSFASSALWAICSPVPCEWQAQAAGLSQWLGLRGCPTICLVPGRIPPMVWALGNRPRLLLPRQLWSAMSPDERTSLLVHELAHLKRRDHWVRWFELIVTGLYWWHPAVWWIRRLLREAEEQCCDAWVVWAMPQKAKTYAAALMAALDFVSGARAAPAAASATSGTGQVACLKRRMRMIVACQNPEGPFLGRTSRRPGHGRRATAAGAELGSAKRTRPAANRAGSAD